MTPCGVNPKRKQAWLRLPHFAIAGLAALMAPGDHTGARGGRSERPVESVASLAADAPSMHTMYVDKPIKGHGLMQAIARVNRVFRDKPAGLVVDYIGSD
jgi:hypothetical protein